MFQENNTHFAGYEALALDTHVTIVSSAWIVPSANCSGSPKNEYYPSAFMWVGIEDMDSVEQIGTATDCELGLPTYYAWYAFYPSTDAVHINSISPGDQMAASVSYASLVYTLTVTDETAGWSRTFTGSGGDDQEGAWIVERIFSGFAEPLTNFTSVTFTSSSMTQIYNGNIISGPITNDAGVSQLSMIDPNGNLMARTSDLSNGGTSFIVTWLSST